MSDSVAHTSARSKRRWRLLRRVIHLLFLGATIGGLPAEAGDTSRPLMLVHYMPWYTAPPFGERWGWHWTMNHFDPDIRADGRRQIASRFYPLIGPYDSSDPDILEYQLLTMKIAGIDGVIVDWYGLTNFRDYAILHRSTTRMLQQCERLKMKFVICYEDQTIPALVKGKRIAASDSVGHAVDEIRWLTKYWFKSGSYTKLQGKPVLLSFGHAGLTNEEWEACLQQLNGAVTYFSQDFRRAGAAGGFGWPSPHRGLQQTDRFLTESERWPAAIPAVFPRFSDVYADAGVQESFPELPDRDGQTFRDTLHKALDAGPPLIQVATWNDWGEGTQIEPSQEYGYRDLYVLQDLRRRQQDVEFPWQHSDLQIPLELLHLRRNGTTEPDEIDRAVKLILANDPDPVRRLIGRHRASTPSK